jgi:hypothetical protein
MEKLREKVSGMKDPAWQVATQDSLLAIREKSPKCSRLS